MTAYVTVQLDIRDPDVFGAYREKASDALARHGGRIEAMGWGGEVLEDTGGSVAIPVLLTFESAEGARDWISDPELASLHDMRKAGARTTITLLAAPPA